MLSITSFTRFAGALLLLALLPGCDRTADSPAAPPSQTSEAQPAHQNATSDQRVHSYQTIEWVELMPESDLEALLNPPDYITKIEDGSSIDQISSPLKQAQTDPTADDPYQQALTSTRIKPEMNKQMIRLPGFVVPLEHNDRQQVIQFFFVPYFGACLHLPPPPPNQIILVDYPDGMPLHDLNRPYWISGQLTIRLTENDTATSAYALNMHDYQFYEEDRQP